jgi:hypothetical protein
MDMEIDEAGKDQSSRGTNFRGPRGDFEVRAYCDDSALIDQHICHAIEPSRIDHVPACNVNSHDSVCSRQEIENAHANGYAVRDLIQNH